MPQAEFEPLVPAIERPQTHILDRAATGIGRSDITWLIYVSTLYVGLT